MRFHKPKAKPYYKRFDKECEFREKLKLGELAGSKQFEIRNLSLFFTIAYAFSWLFWLPQILYLNNFAALPELFVYLVGFAAPFGPLVAAFSITYLTEGSRALKELLKRGLACSFRKRWLATAFLFFPIWAGFSFLIGIVAENNAAVNLPWFSDPLSLVFNFGISNFVYMFIFVGVAEEFGWRGYALDRLQARFSAASSSVILGLIWGLWHLPLFFIPGSNQQAAGIVPYLLQIIVFSVWFTWLCNNSNGSIFAVIIFHTMMDLTLLTIFPIISLFGPNSLPALSLYISGIVILVFVVAFWGPKRLKRQAKRARTQSPRS